MLYLTGSDHQLGGGTLILIPFDIVTRTAGLSVVCTNASGHLVDGIAITTKCRAPLLGKALELQRTNGHLNSNLSKLKTYIKIKIRVKEHELCTCFFPCRPILRNSQQSFSRRSVINSWENSETKIENVESTLSKLCSIMQTKINGRTRQSRIGSESSRLCGL
ncbi:conserved hypothetical protein [Ricinus communis]|uniref:Uncharacterized protein n=1 Tax=Ricinus communis TaxID=3988 RepID=B9SQ08_RICCO|nr:conserved hypothetical protein [Ricinus communis]